MNSNLLHDLKKYVVPTLVICFFGLFFAAFHFTCPILYFTEVPCPCCGMTRALLSLLVGNLRAYLSYNIMALPVLLALCIISFGKKIKGGTPFCYAILILNFLYYLSRLYFFLVLDMDFFGVYFTEMP